MVPRLGRNYKDYLNVDLFTAKREFDFREAFSRSIVVKVVHGIPARIASESDLKILDSLSTREAGEWTFQRVAQNDFEVLGSVPLQCKVRPKIRAGQAAQRHQPRH